jgi:hypothetical protein
MNLLKMTILPGFRARAWPGLEYLNIFWAEKLVLVITQQIFPRNVEKTFFYCIFGSINLHFPDFWPTLSTLSTLNLKEELKF